MEKTHRWDTAIERPAFQKMRFPSHQLADQVAHAIGLQLSVVFSMIFRTRELQWVALIRTCFTMLFECGKGLSCSELQGATQAPKCATQVLELSGLQFGWVAAELRWVAAELRLSCGSILEAVWFVYGSIWMYVAACGCIWLFIRIWPYMVVYVCIWLLMYMAVYLCTAVYDSI